MADSAVTFLLAKLSSLLAEELKVLGGVKGDLVFIKDELEGLRAFLRVADAMERSDPVLQTWVKQVRDITYDTDDVLEEFMLCLASYHRRGLNGFLCKIYYEFKSMKLIVKLLMRYETSLSESRI
ncbi:Disease resistance protein PIK6-NP [Camellia lanceoleosa]|uniref:Disease resistance protein PIK6-NP n=1 Tax=Camellia lanceoleosa TaxID=1840588 RepID=A0ACC0FNT4_9ERIC|nr:Disease resistance protein PIK6-NP [Camellia lanceoleosa]